MMQIAPEQSLFTTLLTRALGVRRAVEVGTFTGMSSLSIALGMPADGRLLCCDVSEEWTAVAKRYWAEAGVANRIELRIGPAADTLKALPPDPVFDLAFIDADKTGYDAYYEACLTLLRPGGMLLIDNMLWSGAVADPSDQDPDTRALRALAAKIHADGRVDMTLAGVGDGLSVVVKR
jgi:predicted O-methyltransferase YrrM